MGGKRYYPFCVGYFIKKLPLLCVQEVHYSSYAQARLSFEAADGKRGS